MANHTDELIQRINYLKLKQSMEVELVRNQWEGIWNSFKPSAILHDVLEELVEPKDVNRNLLRRAFSLGTTYLWKKWGITKLDQSFSASVETLVALFFQKK